MVVLRQLVMCCLASLAAGRLGIDGYSTNAICRQYNCINPVLPGLTDLAILQGSTWQCQDAVDVKHHASFCGNALYYNPGVPSPQNKTELADIVRAQDNAASTTYFYHLSGMNVEPWDHRKPWETQDNCLISVWKSVCHTYFPRAEAGCKKGEQTKYVLPCKNVCENYLNHCAVECCDESVRCAFPKKTMLLDGVSMEVQGYADQDGPAATCTGSAASSVIGLWAFIFLLLRME